MGLAVNDTGVGIPDDVLPRTRIARLCGARQNTIPTDFRRSSQRIICPFSVDRPITRLLVERVLRHALPSA